MTEPVALRRASVAVLLVSAALICFQISFTRLVSYKLYYHFVFLSISLSLLGLAIAGTYVALRPRPRHLDRTILGWLIALADFVNQAAWEWAFFHGLTVMQVTTILVGSFCFGLVSSSAGSHVLTISDIRTARQ